MKLSEETKNFCYLAALFAGAWTLTIGLCAGVFYGIPTIWQMLGG